MLAHIQQEICPSLGKSNQDYTECLHCNPGAQTEVVHMPWDNFDIIGFRARSSKSQPPRTSVLLCKLSGILGRCWCLNSLYQPAQPKALGKGVSSPTPWAAAQPQPQKGSRSEPQQGGILNTAAETSNGPLPTLGWKLAQNKAKIYTQTHTFLSPRVGKA